MSNQEFEFAEALDIWGIIQSEISELEEYAIEEAWLYLKLTGESYVDVAYYDINSLVQEEDEPKMKRMYLTPDNIHNMYRDLRSYVSLPRCVQAIHTHLRKGKLVEFDATFLPIQRKKPTMAGQ